MIISDRTRLERLLHWQGETVLSDDLNHQLAFEAQRRWWHNRLHGAFGVSAGFKVDGMEGPDGEPFHQVSPGLAYDCYGRELILASQRRLQPPSQPSDASPDWTLLATHAAESQFPTSLQPLASQPPFQAPRLSWRPLLRLTPADGVPLARGAFDDNGAFALQEDFLPPPVRPLARPILGSGATVEGRTAWVEWQETAFRNIFVGGIEVEIDTSAAGFTKLPCYFAWLQGDWLTRAGRAITIILSRVVRETPRGFTLSLWVNTATLDPQETKSFISLARQRLWVCWLGIQGRPNAARVSEVPHGTF